MIAGPYCLNKLFAAMIYMVVAPSELMVNLISAPFQFMLLLARFPFFWFLPVSTTSSSSSSSWKEADDDSPLNLARQDERLVSVQNLQFLSWLVGWSYFITGFYLGSNYVGLTAYNFLRILISVVPNIYMMVRTWLTMVTLFKPKTNNATTTTNTQNGLFLDESDRLDNLVKYGVYLVDSVPVLLSLFRNPIFIPIGYGIPLLTSGFHITRFWMAMAANATFSV